MKGAGIVRAFPLSMPLRSLLLLLLLLSAAHAARPLAAQQDAAALAALGHAARDRGDPRVALDHYAAALARDSLHYEANWGAALATLDLGSDFPESGRSARRDSLFAAAERYAARAVAADSSGAEGWFALANAMGRASLALGNRDRARRAGEIREAAGRAVALDPRHSGAWHVLGRWHAEVMRLSGIQRFFARNFLGGKGLRGASWDSATIHLERAVAFDSTRMVHRLALAKVHLDRGRASDARTQLEAAAGLPTRDYGDDRRRREAEVLLAQLARRENDQR
jgi:tetratricopeptide (TPR) repeat protein